VEQAVDPNASGPDRRAEIGQVRVGRMPSGIAVDPGGERIYVANTGSHDVSVVDVQSAMQTARIKVGRRPVALAYVDQLYVAESATGTVSVVAPQGGQMLAKIATGNRPHSLVASWSGDRVYVLNKGDETVCAIDTRTRSVMASAAVGHGVRTSGSFAIPSHPNPGRSVSAATAIVCSSPSGRRGHWQSSMPTRARTSPRPNWTTRGTASGRTPSPPTGRTSACTCRAPTMR
jgi:YVTN family beta-propeller protein